GEFLDLLLDEINDLTFKLDAVQLVDLLNSRGAGDVDFGQKTADHIEADEIETIGAQQRRERGADFLVARRYCGFYHLSAYVNIATRFRFERHSQHGAQGLAVQHDDALIAFADLRQIPLSHYEAPAIVGCEFENRVGVAILLVQ